MDNTKCLQCNKEVKQVAGKRERLYCSDKCRVAHHLSKKRKGKPFSEDIIKLADEVQRLELVIADLRLKLDSKPTIVNVDNRIFEIVAKMKANRAAKIPAERDTQNGRSFWKIDQDKEFNLLLSELLK